MPDTGVEGGKVRRGNGDLVFIGDSFSLGMKKSRRGMIVRVVQQSECA